MKESQNQDSCMYVYVCYFQYFRPAFGIYLLGFSSFLPRVGRTKGSYHYEPWQPLELTQGMQYSVLQTPTN